MRTPPFHHDYRGSDETLSKIAAIIEFLPFRPSASWYDAYWCQDKPARRARGTAPSASAPSLDSLFPNFVLGWLDALSGGRTAPVSRERAEPAGITHRPGIAGGR